MGRRDRCPPLISPIITPGYNGGAAYGKSVTELQDNIQIDGDKITGSLKNVSDYDGFSDNPEEQSGHYLAMQFEAPQDATVTVEVVNGTGRPVELKPDDRSCVFLIRNKDKQKIRVVITSGGYIWETVYDLSGLTQE